MIERARRGDADAYADLVALHQDAATRLAYVITGSADDADDAAQEAFVKAYLALGRFRPGAAFRPWILRIVANEARNRRTAAGRRARLAIRAGVADDGAGAAVEPEAAALAAVQRERMLAAFHDLNPAEQLVIACRYFLELSEAESAAALDCPPGTVKSRLSRALARLRAALAADGAAEPRPAAPAPAPPAAGGASA